MSFAGVFFSLLAYAALLLFVIGLIARIIFYAKTPTPLKIPITPAPKTAFGVFLRMLADLFLFRRVLRSNLWLWAGAGIFHICLWLVIIRHLRYFLYPVPDWVMAMQDVGYYAGYAMPFALLFLLARRLWYEKEVYISTFADYFALLLLFTIACTGLWMTYHGRVFLIDVKAFILGLYSFSFKPPSTHPLFIIHLLSVFTLLVYFPWSKLLHAPGIFFSPSFFQKHNIEKKRHINPWDYDVEPEPFYTLKDKEILADLKKRAAEMKKYDRTK
ncbi:MAG: respiratory nitrate reductase subunit gamma [candidate division Zixibacteria bacterium]|nr:respiratory nitrate reductase subunit gamma [Candidatus Tariuqbacter arcticus]